MTYDILVQRARSNRLAALSSTARPRPRKAGTTGSTVVTNIFADL